MGLDHDPELTLRVRRLTDCTPRLPFSEPFIPFSAVCCGSSDISTSLPHFSQVYESHPRCIFASSLTVLARASNHSPRSISTSLPTLCAVPGDIVSTPILRIPSRLLLVRFGCFPHFLWHACLFSRLSTSLMSLVQVAGRGGGLRSREGTCCFVRRRPQHAGAIEARIGEP